jgi:hypothetical protein
MPVPPLVADPQEPPVSPRKVWTVGLVGITFTFVSLVIGLVGGAPTRGYEPHSLDLIRVALCAIGMVTAGAAVSLRAGWYGGWICLAVAGSLCYGFGAPIPAEYVWFPVPPRDWYAALPNSWDSIQLLCGVVAGVSVAGSLISLSSNMWARVLLIAAAGVGYWVTLPKHTEDLMLLFTLGVVIAAVTLAFLVGNAGWVRALMLVGVCFQFTAILSSVTAPAPSPWFSDQYGKRISRWYQHFAYLNNAYQFYSPNPGPATLLWACVYYVPEGDPNGEIDPEQSEWHYIPVRERDYKDPLGLTYFRRLSLTEQLAQQQTISGVWRDESLKVEQRRAVANDRFPRDPSKLPPIQFQKPAEMLIQHVLPAYARHLATKYEKPGYKVKSLKLYRVIHMLPTVEQFHPDAEGRVKTSHDPEDLLPYFFGDFDTNGKLVNPTDPLLYWLLPVQRQASKDPNPSTETGQFDPGIDYISRHANCLRPEVRPRDSKGGK